MRKPAAFHHLVEQQLASDRKSTRLNSSHSQISYAVFCLKKKKDMQTHLPARLQIGCVLQRDDPRDVVLSPTDAPLAALPQGSRIGTSSLRPRATLRRLHD